MALTSKHFASRLAVWGRSVLLLLLLVAGAAIENIAPARAQDDGVARPLDAARGGGDKAPLFWAEGITQNADLDDYQKLGLNTVVVHLAWTTGAGGEISAGNLAPQRAFAREAAQRGLKIIFALPAAPEGMPGAFRLSADSEAYTALWSAWLHDAVASLKDTPNLLGWMLPDDPRGLGIFDDLGFQRWIGQNYANIEVINRQWDAKFASIDEISLGDVTTLADNWRGVPTLSDAEAAAGKTAAGRSAITRRVSRPDWAFHPAALALAQYKWDAYRALLTTWVGALRGEDSAHLVLSGRTPDYAQLLSLPAGIDIAVPDLAPGVAEDDILTHNPQSIDIARRGGKFGVLPLLSPRASPELPASALPDLTRHWLDVACAHGARGAGFDSFANLQQIPGLALAVTQQIAKLSAPSYAQVWGQPPVNSVAVLLAPLADGQTVQFDTPFGRAPRGLYGFGDDLVEGEPSGLVWSLRWGTAFGGVDYLSPDDLAETSLDRYATIFAPQTLSASNEVAAGLVSYVQNGGVLVADLGLGAVQNGGQANALPPALAGLFGLNSAWKLRPLSFNLNGANGHPLFPSWSGLIAKQPGLSLTLGDGPGATAFSGPVGMSSGSPIAAPDATILASGPRIGEDSGMTTRLYSTGLTINGVGRGYALFAPWRLWNFWRPGQVGFDTFFGDMLSRGATLTQAGVTSLVPAPASASPGTTLYPELINRAASVSLTNHNVPGGNAQLSVVQTASAGDWLWSGALCLLTPETSPLVGSRPAPIANPSEREGRTSPISLYSAVAAGEAKLLSMRPIAVQNLAGGPVAAQIALEGTNRISLQIWPDATAVVPVVDQWQPTVGGGAPVRLTIVDAPDGYQIAPRSRHRMVSVDYTKSLGKNKFATQEQVAVADDRGHLTFELSGAACAVEITPVTELGTNPIAESAKSGRLVPGNGVK